MWTDGEQRKVEEIISRLSALERNHADSQGKLDAIHRALMEKSPAGEPPLLERFVQATLMIERFGWSGKMTIRVIMTVGSVAAALAGIFALTAKVWPFK